MISSHRAINGWFTSLIWKQDAFLWKAVLVKLPLNPQKAQTKYQHPVGKMAGYISQDFACCLDRGWDEEFSLIASVKWLYSTLYFFLGFIPASTDFVSKKFTKPEQATSINLASAYDGVWPPSISACLILLNHLYTHKSLRNLSLMLDELSKMCLFFNTSPNVAFASPTIYWQQASTAEIDSFIELR